MTKPITLPLEQTEFTHELQGSRVRRTVLTNGLRVLTEEMPAARSATIGFWIGKGSADEQAENPHAAASLGSTHFLEHLLFKGTNTRSAYDIAEAFDSVGADHNALTAKEHTCYHVKVRDENIPLAVELLADMVCASKIDNGDFETERGVILEELAMAQDDLTDVAHETFYETVLAGDPLARPIGGTPEIIKAATRESVWQYYQESYNPQTLVVTAAGAVNHEKFLDLVMKALDKAGGRWHTDNKNKPVARRQRSYSSEINSLEKTIVTRDSEQVHLLVGGKSLIAGDERRFALNIANAILGGSMSSRLFQAIREQRGLAYTTYAFNVSYAKAGIFGMYAGCAPENTQEVHAIMRAELERMAVEDVTDQELNRALGQLAGSSALALEDSETRMARLGRAELGAGQLWDLDASLERLKAVTKAEIQTVMAEHLQAANSLVLVGNAQKAGY